MNIKHPALKTQVNQGYHKYSLGRRSFIFKATAVGMDVTYWSGQQFDRAKITRLMNDDEAVLDNGDIISVTDLTGVY